MIRYTTFEISGNRDHGKDTVANYLEGNFNFKKFAFGSGVKRVCAAITGDDLSAYEDRFQKEEMTWLGITRRQLMTYIGTDILREDLPKRFPSVDQKIGDTIWVQRVVNGILAYVKSEMNKVHTLMLRNIEPEDISRDIRVVVSDERMNTENDIMRSLFELLFTPPDDSRKEEYGELYEKMHKEGYISSYFINPINNRSSSPLFPSIIKRRVKILVVDPRKPSPTKNPEIEWHSSETEFLNHDFDYVLDNSADFDYLFAQIESITKKELI